MSLTKSSATFRAINRRPACQVVCLAILFWAGAARAQSSPSGAGSAQPPPATPPSGSSAPPGAAPPPYMYQQPWTPPPGGEPPRSAAPSGTEPSPPPPSPPVYTRPPPPPYPPPYPGPYVYEPPPPPAVFHRAPLSALWVGARLGALFPFGNAYTTGYDPSGYYAFGESWSGMASGGPVVEGDLGVRVARRYIIYGFWEHGWMGTGGDPTWRTSVPYAGGPPFGDQTSASTDYPGLGFRWTSRPDSVGFVIDLGLGYRWFRESWSSGTSVTLKGFGEFRAGFGADIRVNRLFSISPLFMFSTGEFQDREIVVAGQTPSPIASYTGSHGTITLTLGGHFDLAASY